MARNIHQELDPFNLPEPPDGFAWAWNRRKQDFEFQCDPGDSPGRVWKVPGHTAVLLPDWVAFHARKRSVEKMDPVGGSVQRSVVVRYPAGHAETSDADFGSALDAPRPIEYIDRSSSDNPYLMSAPDGLKTHLEYVAVPGGGAQTDARFAPEADTMKRGPE